MKNWSTQPPGALLITQRLYELRLRLQRLETIGQLQRADAVLKALLPKKNHAR